MPRISARSRALIFAAISICVIGAQIAHSYAMLRTHPWPQPTLVGSTGYGAVLTFLVPLSFGWFALGLRSRTARIWGLVGTLFLVYVWLANFANSMKFIGKNPWDPTTWWD